MANELNTVYTSGTVIYALIYRISDGYVWNGTTFEAWVSASIGNYDVPLTCATGSDYYYADFPTTITGSGTYKIAYYIRAGANPAITDTKLEDEELTWNGTAVQSSTTILSTYALTTVEDVRQAMNSIDTSNDDWIGYLINGWSKRIERECGVNFVARDYTERRTGQRERRLVLNQKPIITISKLAYGREYAISALFTGGLRASIMVTSTDVRLSSMSTAGTTTNTTLDFDDYPTSSLLVDAINAVAGWTATLVVNTPSVELNPMGGVQCLDRVAYITYPDTQDVEYTYDADSGIVSFTEPRWGDWWHPSSTMPTGFMNILVNYRAGYESGYVPYDLQMICIDLVTESFSMRNKNPSLMSESLGDYAYKLASQAEISDRHKAMLANYTQKRVGHYS